MSAAAAGAGSESLPVHDRDRRAADPLAGVVFGLLVLACLAAFFLTQRLKHTPTVVQEFKLSPYFSPTPSGREKLESISFKLDRAERVTVRIEDLKGNVVATLLKDHAVARYKQLSLRWNGRKGDARGYSVAHTAHGRPFLVAENSGVRAPAGEYRVRLSLSGQNRVVRSPRSFTLVGG